MTRPQPATSGGGGLAGPGDSTAGGVFAYALALEDNGRSATLARIGVEPSGDPFNSITFDEVHHRPHNPMVNSGALVAVSLIRGRSASEKVARLLQRLRAFTASPGLEVDPEILDQQLRGNDRNLGMSYLMRSLGISVMLTCGMYDAAGQWFYDVGIPAKSGVSGGIVAAIPERLGMAVYSPGLDVHGNSARGIAVCRDLSTHFGLHLFTRSRGPSR